MSALVHRWTTLAVLVPFALATTAADLFHTHGARREAAGACADGCCHHDSAPPVEGERPDEDASAWRARADEACAACRFLGQKPLPIAMFPTVAIVPLVCGPAVVRPVAPATPPLLAFQGRAPPRAA